MLELARGKTKLPLPPPRQVANDPQLPPTDLTRGQVGIPPISENPIKLFTRSEAIREYSLIRPNALPPSGQCLLFEEMDRIQRKYIPPHEQHLPVEIPEYDQDMATYVVQRLHMATAQSDEFIYEHMHGTTRFYLDVE